MSEATNTTIPPQYESKEVEKKWYAAWEKAGVFSASTDSTAKPYVITMPPPNVTGVLHMGHALMCTIEDILIRWKRMQGFNALWVPGTDHAGIATQMVVERNLMKEKKQSKHDLGREKFLEKVWEWKELSQGTILSQMRLIGCSADWSRLAFTLDEGVSRAVREVFVRLYNEKLLYRGEAMIQWCPRCRTALSDLEVKAKETKGKIWQIRYPYKDKPEEGVIVATTRPETLLGDVAVAVNPEDTRYQKVVGRKVIVPLAKREIPIIADAYVDKAFGTGALKITPAHDPNDYIVGKRHKLEAISVMDERAHMNENAFAYKGLSREDARAKVLEDLKEQGLLVKEDAHTHNVGGCDRCGTVVEPRISAQWFVNAEELAKPAIKAVETKEIRILPEEWEKTYFEWMRNIRPWCISRQLWWGHRIPAWFCESCDAVTVAVETPKACVGCKGTKLRQDEDVLDTWFSSGLWPFSTLGWPDDTAAMKKFYPTDVMETGFDILFFWVARMIMLGIKMTGKIPFHTVYLHPMVRDEYGQKMSKTKGNVKDPLEIIDHMGADALRFTLAAMAVHGRDVLLSDSRIEGYRNFVNKIWNAFRFVQMNFPAVQTAKVDETNEVNQWIWTRLEVTRASMNAALENFRFYEAAQIIYHFVWSEYCDWFIELIKQPEELERRRKSQDSTAIQVLEEALRLLHPLMPFVTEEIWQRIPKGVRAKGDFITVASYPASNPKQSYPASERRLGRVIALVDAVRSKRGENNVKPAVKIQMTLVAEEKVLADLKPFAALIGQLAGASEVKLETKRQSAGPEVVLPLGEVTICIPRADLIDVAEEKSRVQKELESMQAEHTRAIAKLENPDFIYKAPPEVVTGVKARKLELEKKLVELKAYLQEL